MISKMVWDFDKCRHFQCQLAIASRSLQPLYPASGPPRLPQTLDCGHAHGMNILCSQFPIGPECSMKSLLIVIHVISTNTDKPQRYGSMQWVTSHPHGDRGQCIPCPGVYPQGRGCTVLCPRRQAGGPSASKLSIPFMGICQRVAVFQLQFQVEWSLGHNCHKSC